MITDTNKARLQIARPKKLQLRTNGLTKDPLLEQVPRIQTGDVHKITA